MRNICLPSSKKIIKKNLTYLNSGGNFLVLFPSPKIINKKNYKSFLWE